HRQQPPGVARQWHRSFPLPRQQDPANPPRRTSRHGVYPQVSSARLAQGRHESPLLWHIQSCLHVSTRSRSEVVDSDCGSNHPDSSDSFPTIPPRKLRFLSFFSTCTRARPHKNALLRHTSRLRNASIFHILKLALGFSSTQDFAAAARGKNP